MHDGMQYDPIQGQGHGPCWLRSTAVERWSLAGELSLSCTRPVANG